MRVLIIEDEPLNAEIIIDFLNRYDSAILVSAQLKSKDEAKKWLDENGQADLVFSDIELLDGNVFSLLKDNVVTSPIIFTTAYNSFYQEAFDVNGIDYLLKPLSYDRFSKAMKKLESLSSRPAKTDWRVISELLHENRKKYKERIIIKNAGEIHLLPTQKTVAILSNSGKLTAVDEEGTAHEFRAKLADLADELDPKTFFQINRGEIININFIEKIEPYFGDRLSVRMQRLKNKLITSAAATADFRKWLG